MRCHPVPVAVIAGQLVVGGAERQLYLWLANLDRRQFQPVVLTLHPGHDDYWEKPIEALGFPLLRIPQRRFRVFRLLDIVRVLQTYKPELIHGWHLFASPYGGLAAKWFGAKSIGGVRGTYPTFNSHPLESMLTMVFTDAILANSKSAAVQLVQNRKRKHQRIFAVQNAVEASSQKRGDIRPALADKYGLAKDAVWLGSISRLDPKKRFDRLLQVLALLKAEQIDFHFLLIGDGPLRETLSQLARRLGIENRVTFAGEIPMASQLLKALDIFCFTSQDEGLPNVIMEAAAAGLPIVSWRYPFIEELLQDRQTALLPEPEDLAGMKNALIELINNPTLRAQLGEAARQHVLGCFSLERYITGMTGVYQELLGGQPSPARVKP